jgi:hypothetical protein
LYLRQCIRSSLPAIITEYNYNLLL